MPKERESRYSRFKRRFSRNCDYAFARTRAGLSYPSHAIRRAYDLALAESSPRRLEAQLPLTQLFREQVEIWKDKTGHLSSITKAIGDSSYLRIIGLAKQSTGHEIERLLLNELEAEPDHWFAALTAITGEDPVKPEDNFDDAVAAWLAWGREKGII
jgi:hypothetical protein